MLSEKKIVDWYFRLVGFFGLENLSSWMYWCTTKRIPRIHCQWLTSFPPESAYPALLNCWTWQIRIGILDSTGSVLPECSFDAQSFFPISSTSFRKVEWAGERMNGQVGGATLFVFGLLSISFLSGLCCKVWSLGLVCGLLYGFVKFFDDQFRPFLLNQHIWRSEIAGACHSDLESLYLKAVLDKIRHRASRVRRSWFFASGATLLLTPLRPFTTFYDLLRPFKGPESSLPLKPPPPPDLPLGPLKINIFSPRTSKNQYFRSPDL